MSKLIANIRALAAHRNIKQTEIGRATGVDQSTLSRIMASKTTDPGYQTVQKIARFFGVSMDSLVNDDLTVAAPPVGSQPVGLDAPTLTSALKLLTEVSRIRQEPLPQVDAQALLVAIEIIEEAEEAYSSSNVLDFMTKYVERLERGVKNGTERQEDHRAGRKAQ
ncbi:helix-turn-helix domain-containing protein [Stenotrophomonas sp. AB1(2024)]|uniref:helix-turn-helix domain-containing protein n=1 Tax=Stenotrophomonas sp. AB1(2024) TaxID=3132215 RepID=UPI0030B57B5F